MEEGNGTVANQMNEDSGVGGLLSEMSLKRQPNNYELLSMTNSQGDDYVSRHTLAKRLKGSSS